MTSDENRRGCEAEHIQHFSFNKTLKEIIVTHKEIKDKRSINRLTKEKRTGLGFEVQLSARLNKNK
jgi:hypothetical protein